MGLQASSGVQCENEAFSQDGHKKSARGSHWNEQQGANSRGSCRLQKGSVREGLKLRKIWKKDKKKLRNFWTQRDCQGLLKTQRLIEMKNGKVRENFQGKTTKKWVASPVESPILLSD
jgi:hypothetical protein